MTKVGFDVQKSCAELQNLKLIKLLVQEACTEFYENKLNVRFLFGLVFSVFSTNFGRCRR